MKKKIYTLSVLLAAVLPAGAQSIKSDINTVLNVEERRIGKVKVEFLPEEQLGNEKTTDEKSEEKDKRKSGDKDDE